MVTRFRTVQDAHSWVTMSIRRDAERMGQPGLIDPNTPDGDPGKFLLRGRPARAIHLHDGYHLKIRSEWFRDVEALPVINGGEFDWYVFAVEPRREVPEPHYLILHHTTMKSLVLDFKAPRGRNWRDQDHWMANIRPFSDGTAYFRWGDEPAERFRQQITPIQARQPR